MAGGSVIVSAIERMNEAERAMARGMLRHYEGEWRRLRHRYPKDLPSVAHTIHTAIDDRTADLLARDPMAGEVKCQRGCAACCHVNVDVTLPEAQLLLAVAHELGVEIDRDLLMRQATASGVERWRDLAPGDRRCVFLGDDDACRVYEHRPGACRKYLVVSDPALCDTIKHPATQVAILLDIEGELMHAAALKTLGHGTMAAMLAVAIAEEAQR